MSDTSARAAWAADLWNLETMKKIWLGVLATVMAVTLVAQDVEAKRLGGGKSTGMQRNMPARTAPDAAPAKPATPTQSQTPAQQAAPAAANPAAAAAAAPAKRNWLGPIAGLAAGLGIAALLSHFGLGEGFASLLTMLLLAAVAFFAIRFLISRFRPQPAAAAAGMQRNSSASGAQVAWPAAGSGASASPASPAAAEPLQPVVIEPQPAAPAVAKAFVPAAFDSESFERVAKMIFIRLQAANDARDLDDLRSFTTPEMFAELSLDIQDRGGAAQTTEVVQVAAKVLDVVQEGDRQIVSVRFDGQVREAPGADPVTVAEVWHLVKPVDDSRSWAIAGIEQLN